MGLSQHGALHDITTCITFKMVMFSIRKVSSKFGKHNKYSMFNNCEKNKRKNRKLNFLCRIHNMSLWWELRNKYGSSSWKWDRESRDLDFSSWTKLYILKATFHPNSITSANETIFTLIVSLIAAFRAYNIHEKLLKKKNIRNVPLLGVHCCLENEACNA